ncbi:MAG TPA: hypothetical protein VNZ26_28160 [Vicinamibacterales bacterium]|nr:hypothetical protein [Vicinamibacterales bacterium]
MKARVLAPEARAPLPGIKHLAFFRALAALREDCGRNWCELACGLAAMRLVDWSRDNPGEPLPEVGVQALKHSIETLESEGSATPTLVMLQGIASAMFADADRGDSVVLQRTTDYGDVLYRNAHWSLAEDVFQTIIEYPCSDRAILPSVYLRLGRCRRRMGQFVAASATYESGRELADELGDTHASFRLRIAEAQVVSERGDFAAAEVLLDDIAAEACLASLPTMRASALHDRATVAQRRGAISRALPLYFDALDLYTEPAHQDRVICDIGLALLQVEQFDLARDALLIVREKAVAQELRWNATLNLLEMAVARRDKAYFDEYRIELGSVELPVRLALYYQLIIGDGWLRFDHSDHARTALDQAIQIAERFGAHDADGQIDQLRQAVNAGSDAEAMRLMRFDRRRQIDQTWADLSTRLDIRRRLREFRDRLRSAESAVERPARRAAP